MAEELTIDERGRTGGPMLLTALVVSNTAVWVYTLLVSVVVR